MIAVDVKSDISGALAKFAMLRQDVADKAVTRALNKVAAQAKTEASKQIRAAGYGIKAASIKKAIDIRRARSGYQVAVLRASGRPLPLIAYGARQTQKGVTVAVKNGRKLIKGAFIATMGSGHAGVFERVPGAAARRVKYIDSKGRANNKQLPVREMFGPSIPSAFINKTVQAALVTAVRERFPKVLQQELNYAALKA